MSMVLPLDKDRKLRYLAKADWRHDSAQLSSLLLHLRLYLRLYLRTDLWLHLRVQLRVRLPDHQRRGDLIDP